jgi:PAS domain S-box-containing protein
VEHSIDGVALINTQGTILYSSPSTTRILGYTVKELTGRTIFDIIHPEDHDLVRSRLIGLLFRPGGHASAEFRARHKEGQLVWVEGSGVNLLSEPNVHAILCNFRNIGERHLVVAERKQAEEMRRRWATTVESSDDAIFLTTLDGIIQSWNPGAEKIFGYAAEEIIGRPVSLIYSTDRPGETQQVRDRLVRGEHLTHYETAGARKDGTHIHVSLTISPIKDAAGKIIAASATARDITERRQAEDALRKSEERFRLVARAANDAVWDWDLLTDQVWHGEGYQTLFGYPGNVVLPGMEWWKDNIHPEDRERVTTGIRAVIDRGGQFWSDEYRFRRADGTTAYVFDRGYVLRDAGGQPLRMIGAINDMTERKRAEEALWKAREADQANQAKSEFLSRMSHELRTPLNAILGFAQLLEIDSLNPEQEESVGHILKAGRHLLELINEVLDISRIEAGRLSISLEPVPLRGLVQETLDLITPLAAKASVRLDAEAADIPDRTILADRQRMKQVLLNLLSNAVKYNHPGGTVSFSYGETPEGRLRISVRDTGPGIPPERMERLFIPFERLGAEQTGVEGTGLGLTLSKRLVELMEGTLGVESTVGQGSTFWVEMALAESPVARLEKDLKTVLAPTASPASKETRTVLYVEDNLSNLELLQRLLAHRPGIRFLPAMQGRLGLDLAREHRPDLILLDLHLPDVQGDEVLRRLREDPKTRRIPVVIISADAMPVQINRLMAAGARAYLTKPLDIKKFLDLFYEILSEPRPTRDR